MSAQDRQVARLVTNPVGLLITAIVLLIDHHQTQARHRGKDGRSSADHHARFAALSAVPGGAALAGQSSDVQAVGDFFGPTQFVPEADHYDATGWMVERLIGGTLAERRDVAVRASPATYVSASAAPILIVHGDEDEVVDLYQSTSFHALLVAAGADSTLRIVKGGGHGRGGEFSDRSLLAVVGEFFDRTLAPGRSVVNSSRLGYP